MDEPGFNPQGVVEKSPLLDIDGPFSLIDHMPPEPFHLVHEGLTKLMLKRLFEDSSTVESREILARWENGILDMYVFQETPRCTRRISTGQMKGSEYATIALSAFPALIPILRRRQKQHW